MERRLLILVALVAGCVDLELQRERPSYSGVTAGEGYSCARVINSDTQQFVCWGADIPATHPPDGIHEMIQAAGTHACSIDGERHPRCWGDPGDPIEQVPMIIAPAPMAVSSTHACALHLGTIPTCWGATSGATVPSMPDQGALALAAGVGHTCMLDFYTHQAVCWGRDDMGQSSPPGIQLLAIVAGDGYTCGLDQQRAMTCWGRALPNMPAAGTRFLTIVAGPSYACGIDDSSHASCWGDAPASLLSPPADVFDSIAVAGDHACGVVVTDTQPFEHIECWGDNTHKQLDVPTLEAP